MPRYTRAQLTVAKVAVVVAASVLLGIPLTAKDAPYPVAVVGALILLGVAVGAYEALACGLASLLGVARGAARGDAGPPVEAERESVPDAGVRGPAFGTGQAVLCLVSLLGAQVVVWMAVFVVAIARVGIEAPAEVLADEVLLSAPPALPAGFAASALVLLVFLRRWSRRSDWAELGARMGLSWGSARANLCGAVAGPVLAIGFLVAVSLSPDLPEPEPSLMSRLAADQGPGLAAWALTAVVLAGPTEEVLFRGVLLEGLRSSISLPVAALTAGFLFWLLHLPEILLFWPAAIVLGALALVVTLLRLRARAVGPAIACHVAYNLTLAGLMVLAAAR